MENVSPFRYKLKTPFLPFGENFCSISIETGL
jgi:hypothetical protein